MAGTLKRWWRGIGRWSPAALLLLSGCSAVGTLNALEPRGGVTISQGLSYADGPRHGLDVYIPRASRRPGGAPVVVFFYGGNWDSGAKADYRFVGAALARRGYLAIVPDYRVYPQALYPAFLEDSARAVRWARDHAATYGGDPGALFVMGHSAGAYNAAMLALDPEWLAEVGMDPAKDLRGMIGLAGPYDFLPLTSERLKVIFGPEDQRARTQPIAYARAQAPPLLLAHDDGDKIVLPRNTIRLSARMREVGGRVEERHYRRLTHALMIGVVATPLRFLAPVFHDLTGFIDAQAAVKP